MSQLGDALFTTTQQKALSLLYARPEKSFYTKEILRLTGMGVATIKRELDRMLAAGILHMTKIGNQHHYQANPECPIYQELIGIVKKTFGVLLMLCVRRSCHCQTILIGHLFLVRLPVAKRRLAVILT